MIFITRLMASKAVRRALLVLALSVAAAVWGIPPEVVDAILTAVSN